MKTTLNSDSRTSKSIDVEKTKLKEEKKLRLKEAKARSRAYLPGKIANLSRAVGEQIPEEKSLTKIAKSALYNRALDSILQSPNRTGFDATIERELYAGVCGTSNPCAFTDMTHMLHAILEGAPLKWDQPYNCKRPAQEGDLMGFILGTGFDDDWAGTMFVFEIHSILDNSNREPHWSDAGYSNEHNSRLRGCVLFRNNFAVGRWVDSGEKRKQGFTHIKTGRDKFVIEDIRE